MGFDRKSAKKALKLTGDVNNAVTFLLESGELGLDQVSMSEEESIVDAEEKKRLELEAKAKAEEERKLKLDAKASKRSKLISVQAF